MVNILKLKILECFNEGVQMQKKDKYDKHDSPVPNRSNTFMSTEDLASGKKSVWYELEINGVVRNLSPDLFKLSHLTSLYLNGNSLSRIPCEVNKLVHLAYLDLSHNKLRSLPSELGDLTMLRELLLDYNALRVLPYELGKLFNLQNLGLSYNPLSPEIMSIFNSSNGTQKLLSYMLDNLAVSNTSCKYNHCHRLASEYTFYFILHKHPIYVV
ncbi:CCR4 [Mytilus edulis]|uniref:CNOT6 n=1 Tax=Mytilus edulis TaxID=6550 RepID=A0A8S3SH55_MYTED|nr:CCR4 [Mytilus edulis]